MSIIAPASSRWSLPAGANVRPTRAGRCPRRRRSGRAGSAASPRAASSSSASRVSSGSSSLTRALTACISAIASDASAPVRLASPIAFAPALRSACASSSSGRSAFSRSRAASAARSRSSDAVAAPRKRGPHGFRVAADRPQVEHRALLRGRAVGGCRAGWVTAAWSTSARNSATSSASSPVTMFCGIGPGREPAVADRVQRAVLGDLALVEVRAVLVLAGPDVRRRALGARHAERVAARAALVEDLRGGRLIRRDREIPSSPQAATTAGGRGEKTGDQQQRGGPSSSGATA